MHGRVDDAYKIIIPVVLYLGRQANPGAEVSTVEATLSRLIFNSISEGVFTVDGNCVITAFNTSADGLPVSLETKPSASTASISSEPRSATGNVL